MAGKRRFSNIMKHQIAADILQREVTLEEVKAEHSVKLMDIQRWLGEYVIAKLNSNSEAKLLMSTDRRKMSPEEQNEMIGLKAQIEVLQELLIFFISDSASKNLS